MRIFILVIVISISSVFSQSAATYHDGHGLFVYFPYGAISFADEIVSTTDGTSMTKYVQDKNTMIGIPNFHSENKTGFYSLGCGGSAVYKFTNNALTDLDGPDLYVFEVGSEIEPSKCEISKDGINWIDLGEVNGGNAQIDIHDYVKKGDVFYYVRLTDLMKSCRSSWPGADIDAVGAIGTIQQVNISSSLMFDNDSYTIKSKEELDKIVNDLNQDQIQSIQIVGHTDNVGSDDYNLTLSKNRANAVKTYFSSKFSNSKIEYKVIGKGETEPIATNETEEGKQVNRRVSILITPKTLNQIDKSKFKELSNVLVNCWDLTTETWLADFPKPISDKFMKNAPYKHIDDALYFNDYIYFFEGKNVLKYSVEKSILESTNWIETEFKGVTLSSVKASFVMNELNSIYFINKDSTQTFTYDKNGKTKVTTFLNEEMYPGLKLQEIDCALALSNGNYFFFDDGKVQTYNVLTKKPISEVSSIANAVWGTLWLSGPDAIVDDGTGIVYFFKNQ